MCGRYDYTPGEFREIRIRWNLDKEFPLFKPRYNIAPGKQVPVIVQEAESNQMKLMRSGLVPSCASDPSIGNRMINARAETLAEKPSFMRLLTWRRCLVPAGGF